MMKENRFYYFICNPGSELLFKEEMAQFHPELRFSFSTKNFLTYKLIENELRSEDFIFCLHYGEFVAKSKLEEIMELQKKCTNKEHFLEYHLTDLPTLNFSLNLNTEYEELIVINDKEVYWGKFKTTVKQFVLFTSIELPPEAPSRAYLKIKEALKILDIKLQNTDSVLEIGSSPGGATFAMLEAGLRVIGIDPGIMHENCMANKNFTHINKSIQNLQLEEINQDIHWLLVDMNLAPEATLSEIERVIQAKKATLKGVFITMKLTKVSLISRLPFYKKLILRMGLEIEFMGQLKANKQEFLIFATP